VPGLPTAFSSATVRAEAGESVEGLASCIGTTEEEVLSLSLFREWAWAWK
jgi:hypothetical protein